MTANTIPIFVLTPVLSAVRISTANANRDGTGTLGTLVTGGTNGTRLTKIIVKATGTTTLGMIRFFVYDGVNTRIWFETKVTAITPSASVATFYYAMLLLGENALFLPSGYSLKVSTHNAEQFDVTAYGGSY